jgi:hypothetical protein
MRTGTNKQRILAALDSLADDASIEEAMELLYFLGQVEKSRLRADAGQPINHELTKH